MSIKIKDNWKISEFTSINLRMELTRKAIGKGWIYVSGTKTMKFILEF